MHRRENHVRRFSSDLILGIDDITVCVNKLPSLFPPAALSGGPVLCTADIMGIFTFLRRNHHIFLALVKSGGSVLLFTPVCRDLIPSQNTSG